MEVPTGLITLAGGVAFLYILSRYFSKRSIKHLRGPSSPFLLGNLRELLYQEDVGDLDFKWLKEYGTAWRIGGNFGEDVLMVADPKALQHIFHKSGYHYPKPKNILPSVEMVTGRGILWVSGNDHERHRKVMSPAFTAPQLRSFLPIFQSISSKMTQMWKDEILTESGACETILVDKWLARTTLDVIGETAFGYKFGALANEENEVSEAYKNMFVDSVLYPSLLLSLFRATWSYLPKFVLDYVHFVPTREHLRFGRTLKIVNKVSKQLIHEKTEALSEDGNKKARDVMSVLVNANVSENPKTRLNEEEMVSQMATLTLAGHDTTANTITWLLWEVAKHPEYQAKMRQEIEQVRSKVQARGDVDFTIDDLDSMEFVLSAIKETLRFHAIVYHLMRSAGRDDVLPLANPIYSKTGEVISEIPISAGQQIMVSICAYNRLPDVWGNDANEWNPMRFMKMDTEKLTKVGMFANLMSFSAGIRGCIGWRFSMIEMQAIVADLLENFEFAIPADKPDIQRIPAGLMSPVVRGKMYEGTQMPLRVTLVR